ncbi:MAG TPA: DUF4160 domain-containing protein [Anaerolineae bacterium]|nr:DUF4160 domain-containing protein [Anaerolineae bacterium]
MYYDDHQPPHFHAIYGGAEAQIAIDPIYILRGDLPDRAVSMIIEWAALHQRELSDNWQRMRSNQQPQKVKPLQ